MRTQLFLAAALALAATLPAVQAQAQVNRTFVSAAGSDSNNCANVTTPCRHFAAAYAATAPSGEIFVLDPANYGSLAITHGISIEGHGWASIAPPNGGNAITINALSGDSISIHGVAINGTGATGGTNGIVFNSGGSLTVTDCVVQNFRSGISPLSGNGIVIQPGFGGNFAITNTTVSNNDSNGILMSPTGGSLTAAITNTTLANNNFGFLYQLSSGSPGSKIVLDHDVASGSSNWGFGFTSAGGGTLDAAVSNSTASGNFIGIVANFGTLSVDNTTINGNSDEGVSAVQTATVMLSRSVIQGNGVGIHNTTSPNTFYTYGNNLIDANGQYYDSTAPNTSAQLH
jgi:hypothetical protein